MAALTPKVDGGTSSAGESWWPGRACRSWTASYIDPLHVRAGDALQLLRTDEEWPGWVWVRAGEANEGWIPARFVSETEPHRAQCDYDAAELTVAEGDPLLLGREVDGWIRCSTTGGEVGWLPAYCCEPVHESEHG